jgi:hypothetical protein
MKDQENYWHKANIEAMEKFESEMYTNQMLLVNFWQTIISLNAVILGITVGLSGYLGSHINWLIICTWLLQIVVIFLGLFIIWTHIKRENIKSISKMMFSYDMSEIHVMESKGELSKEDKIGLGLAAILRKDYITKFVEKTSEYFTDKAKELASFYRDRLPSSGIFKIDEIEKEIKSFRILFQNFNRIVVFFYFLTCISVLSFFLNAIIHG